MNHQVRLILSSRLALVLTTLLIGLAQLALPGLAAAADPYYLRSDSGRPWDDPAFVGNEPLLDDVFGPGHWVDARFETVDTAVLFAEPRFIFMDGSDMGADELEAFLDVNRAAIESFVQSGGVVFINAAPNEGDGMNLVFGVSLVYVPSTTECSLGCNSVASGNPIYSGPFTPVGENYNGDSFSHAVLSGTFTPLMVRSQNGGDALLGELYTGSGLAILGGMTIADFHTPPEEASNLRRNILAYGASKVGAPQPPVTLNLAAGGQQNVNTSRTLSATATTPAGGVSNATVIFGVAGANTASGSAQTDATGNAFFSYVGTAAGSDAIVACVDQNHDDLCGAGEPSATATASWAALPTPQPTGSTVCRLGYFGWVDSAHGAISVFSGFASFNGQVLKGEQLFEHFAGGGSFRLGTAKIDRLTCAGGAATLVGSAVTNRGIKVKYQIDVKDVPGLANDRYRLRLSNGFDTGDRVVRFGNVEVR